MGKLPNFVKILQITDYAEQYPPLGPHQSHEIGCAKTHWPWNHGIIITRCKHTNTALD